MEARDKPSIGQSTSDEEKHRMVCNNSISSPAQSNLGTLVRRPALNDLASTPGEPFPLRGVTTDDSTAWWPHPSIHPSDPLQGAVGNPRIRPAPLWHPACRLGAVPAWWVGSYTHGRCGTRGMFVSPQCPRYLGHPWDEKRGMVGKQRRISVLPSTDKSRCL